MCVRVCVYAYLCGFVCMCLQRDRSWFNRYCFEKGETFTIRMKIYAVTNSLFQLQTTKRAFPSRVTLSNLMHCSILLCHASKHCWKDSSCILRSSAVTALDNLHSFKMCPPPWPLFEPRENNKVTGSLIVDQVNSGIVSIRRCYPGREMTECSGHCERVNCRGLATTICPGTTSRM